jgi:hypothetical protein
MEHLEYARRINAPADAVWAYVGDFGSPAIGEGFVERVEVIGKGVGMERIFHLPEHMGGGSVRERLDDHDDSLRSYAYRLTDNGPLPWTGYEGRITVTPCGPDACAVLARIQLVPVTARPEECAAISMSNMNLFFENLEKLVRQ